MLSRQCFSSIKGARVEEQGCLYGSFFFLNKRGRLVDERFLKFKLLYDTLNGN